MELTKTVLRRCLAYWPVASVAILTSLWLPRNIDFAVYWHSVRGFVHHSLPLYGPASGIGYPMIFRYPPVAYLLLWPLGTIPLPWAGFIWMLGAWTASVASIQIARQALALRFRRSAVLLSFACMLAYFVLSVRSGNIQPYLIAMIFAAITISSTRPVLAAVLLAVCISFKVWPAFFLPCFLRQERRAALIWLAPAIVTLWLIPMAMWSPSEYSNLIRQWCRQELAIVRSNSELWYYPGQSLRGILLRYTTSTNPWLHGFPDVHFLCLSPALVVRMWLFAATGSYLIVCTAMLRAVVGTQWAWDGFLFALFSILEPFCPKSSMISLGPALLVAAAMYSGGRTFTPLACAWTARRLFLFACVLSLSGALVQYRPAIRFMLAIGVDFYVNLLLMAALAFWILDAKALQVSHASQEGENAEPAGKGARLKGNPEVHLDRSRAASLEKR